MGLARGVVGEKLLLLGLGGAVHSLHKETGTERESDDALIFLVES